jgi:hypothetical protein
LSPIEIEQMKVDRFEKVVDDIKDIVLLVKLEQNKIENIP